MDMREWRHGDPADASRGQQIAFLVLAGALTALGLWTIKSFLPALVWAAVLAIAIWPLYQRARNRWPPGRHDILIPAGFTAAVALVFVLPLALAGVQLGREAHGLFDWIRTARTSGVPAPDWLAHLPVGGEQATAWWKANLSDPAGSSELLRRLDQGDLFAFSRHMGSQLLHRAVLFAFTLLTLFFLFRDGQALSKQLRRASLRAFGRRGERVSKQMVASVHGTVDGLVLVGLGEGVLLGGVYAVAGVPHPTLLGALTAVAAMIPFGAPLMFGLAALLLVAQGSAVAAIVVLGVGMVVTFVADHFVRPVLIGGATRLPFIWVLFGILGGVEAWGLLGLFVGPAVMAALILLWREATDARSG